MALRRVPGSLDEFIGNARVVDVLKRAIARDRLPHAMIFAGPEGVGKCTLALLIAQYLNCLAPRDDGSCGKCSVCTRIMAVIESRYLKCLKADDGFCGSCAHCRIRTRRHPDIRLVEPEKTTISIGQVRELINEIAFQPLEARYRVVILDPAEQMRAEAQNSLLKTLEEPASRTVIILVTTNPYVLLQTIRSRSRVLQFGEISPERIEKYLFEQQGRTVEDSRLAAALSGGRLAAALGFNTEEYREIRRLAFHFVVLLLKRGRFSDANAIAVQVTKDKEHFERWVESVAALLRDIYFIMLAPERVGERELLGKMEEVAAAVDRSRVVGAINAVNKLKGDLQFNVNRQLALEAMFLGFAGKR